MADRWPVTTASEIEALAKAMTGLANMVKLIQERQDARMAAMEAMSVTLQARVQGRLDPDASASDQVGRGATPCRPRGGEKADGDELIFGEPILSHRLATLAPHRGARIPQLLDFLEIRAPPPRSFVLLHERTREGSGERFKRSNCPAP